MSNFAKLSYVTQRVVDLQSWNRFVSESYGRPYDFQQQEGCKPRGTYLLEVPGEANDFVATSIPEEVNGEQMGVSFEAWKSRDPKAPVGGDDDDFSIGLFWERNFYPDIQMIANDLHAQGKLEAGTYLIDIDW